MNLNNILKTVLKVKRKPFYFAFSKETLNRVSRGQKGVKYINKLYILRCLKTNSSVISQSI